MTTHEEREYACAAFLEPQGMGYIRSFDVEGETFWALFDDRGRELVAQQQPIVNVLLRRRA